MENDIIFPGEESKTRGNWITCKLCKKQWKFKTPEARISWKEINFQCPYCKEEYSILPETERELRKLQDAYFANNRDEKYLNEIFKVLSQYAESLIKKQFGSRLNFIDTQIENYAKDATSLLMEKYTDPDFEISVSFGGFLSHKIKEAIFGKKTHTCAPETLNYKYEDGNFVEQEDFNKRELDRFIDIENRLSLSEELAELVYELEEICSSSKENYIRLLNVLFYLNKNQKQSHKFFKVFERIHGKFSTERTLDILEYELRYLWGERVYTSTNKYNT